MLFQHDMTKNQVGDIISGFWEMNAQPEGVVEFANQLFKGTIEQLDRIDAIIQAHAIHWSLARMATVDRNVLRLAVYEFLAKPETPKAVIINEALEIVKKFSTDDSAHFVNGILDSIKTDLTDKPASCEFKSGT